MFGQLFEFKTRLIPRVRNWDCSEPWGMGSWTTFDTIESQTLTCPWHPFLSFFFLYRNLWSYQPGNQCLLVDNCIVPVFFGTLYLDFIETNFLTPIETHPFVGTSGPAFYIAKSSMLATLNSIDLIPCFCTFFLCHSQFYRVNKSTSDHFWGGLVPAF